MHCTPIQSQINLEASDCFHIVVVVVRAHLLFNRMHYIQQKHHIYILLEINNDERHREAHKKRILLRVFINCIRLTGI